MSRIISIKRYANNYIAEKDTSRKTYCPVVIASWSDSIISFSVRDFVLFDVPLRVQELNLVSYPLNYVT